MTRHLFFLICLLATAALLGCISKTTLYERVTQSAVMDAPPNQYVSNPEQFSFAVVGDLHISFTNTSRLVRILDAAESEGDEFLLLLGDLVDGGDLADVQAIAQTLSEHNWRNRTYVVAGNHDIFHDGWTHFKEVFGSSTYEFRAGNSRFIALDTADGAVGEWQKRWLENRLAQSATVNTFFFSHYLPIVPGITTYLRLSSENESLNLMTLASRNGVRAWLGAHYHSHVQAKIGGVEYVIAGGGGGRRMPPVEEFFFVQVAVNKNEISYRRRPVL